MKMSSSTHARRIRERRRIVFRAGMAAVAASAALAVAVGAAGCIFDEGDYQGGGRRSTTPTSTETTTAPTSQPTTTSTPPAPTSTGPADSGSPIPDAGALDD